VASTKSAKKRVRQNKEKRLRNRSAKSALRTSIKKFGVTAETGDGEAVAAAFRTVQEKVDKTAAKGIIRKGTAARIKSRLSARVKATQGAKRAGS